MTTQEKLDFATEANKAIFHERVQTKIDDLLLNIGVPRNSLIFYGILKVANSVSQIARAQALGIDPKTLQLTEEEAHDEMVRRAALIAGVHGEVMAIAVPAQIHKEN